MPIIDKRGGQESTSNAFRYLGFGKYRKDHLNKQKKPDGEDSEDTDGVYYETIDGNDASGTKCKHRVIVNCEC